MTMQRVLKSFGKDFVRVEFIEFLPEGAGEAGYMVHLKDGFSFDPLGNDVTRFIPADDLTEADNLVIFAAEKPSAAVAQPNQKGA